MSKSKKSKIVVNAQPELALDDLISPSVPEDKAETQPATTAEASPTELPASEQISVNQPDGAEQSTSNRPYKLPKNLGIGSLKDWLVNPIAVEEVKKS